MTVRDLSRWEETDEPGVYRRRRIEPAATQPTQATQETTEVDETEISATAGALDLAAQHDIDLATITGTGKDGRITKSDVEAAL